VLTPPARPDTVTGKPAPVVTHVAG
jgi:hypothetical protein